MIRRLVALWVVFTSVASAQETPAARELLPLSPFRAAKARALFRDRLPCAGCHVLDRSGGRVGPDLSHVGERRSAAYVRRMLEDPQAAVPGTVMPKVPMPASTRELIVAYLTRSIPTGAGRERASDATREARDSRKAAPANGEALYAHYCAACHGASGRGNGPNAAYLPVRPARHADAGFMSRRSDDRLFDAIHAGGYPLGRSVTMPPYGATLTKSEIWALVDYLRELCRCAAPAWSTDGDSLGRRRGAQ